MLGFSISELSGNMKEEAAGPGKPQWLSQLSSHRLSGKAASSEQLTKRLLKRGRLNRRVARADTGGMTEAERRKSRG